MANDPIERIAVDLEIYGIPQPPGMPAQTESYFHIRRRQNGAGATARLGLPAYEGKQGKPGPPGAVHQGERTQAQLDALAQVLDTDQTNWSYRNTDTDDQYVWNGETFIVYTNVYATPGTPGPPPALTPGALTIDGVAVTDPDFGIRIDGGNGDYTVGIDLPEMPQGEPGPPGSSGPVFTSVDVDQTSTKHDGDVLVYRTAGGKLRWEAGSYVLQEYVVPPSNFPNVTKSSNDTRQQLCAVTIPAKTFPYRFDFTGGVDILSNFGHQIDLEIRTNVGTTSSPETTGPLVGMGKGQDGEGWREVAFRAHSDVALDPSSTAGIIPPGTTVQLYVSAVKRAGILFGWQVRNDRAQLRIRLLRTAA